MKSVVVNWTVEQVAVANAASADHFTVNIGPTEQRAPLNTTSLRFDNVNPGTYAVSVQISDSNNAPLAVPVTVQFVVSPDATAPVPVTVSAVIA